MNWVKIFTAICIFVSFNQCIIYSEEEKAGHPRIGIIESDDVNVRAGSNINYESLCKLNKGDRVEIIGESYGWYRIILPKKAHLYIKSDYVDFSFEQKIAEVNARRVNLRAGPDTNHSILGQVSKPYKLDIMGESAGWYQIEPPDGVSGWIHSLHVRVDEGKKGEAASQ